MVLRLARSRRNGLSVIFALAMAAIVTFQWSNADHASAACSVPQVQQWDSSLRKLVWKCPDVPEPNQGNQQPESPSEPGVVEERHCFRGTQEVECSLPGGLVWNGERLCYDKKIDDPPADDPRWAGHLDEAGNPTGAIMGCFDIVRCVVDGDNLRIGCDFVTFRWVPQAPEPQGPNPAEVAREVVASMQLRAGRLGMAPPSYTDRPGSQFIVGIQAWFWVDDPAEVTTGPVTAQDPTGALSATARVDRVVIDTGDGGSLTCTPRAVANSDIMEVGTQWTRGWDEADSPDCGYTYARPGNFTVTARTYWTVTWAGMGESGSIPVDVVTTVPVRVGEIQVLIVK